VLPGMPAVPADANSQSPEQMSEGGIASRGIAKAAMQMTLVKKVENGRSASPGRAQEPPANAPPARGQTGPDGSPSGPAWPDPDGPGATARFDPRHRNN